MYFNNIEAWSLYYAMCDCIPSFIQDVCEIKYKWWCVGYVIALDSTEKPSGEIISKRALVSLVYSNEVYLLMSYDSSINVSIGEMVHVSWRKNNAKLCGIDSVIKL